MILEATKEFIDHYQLSRGTASLRGYHQNLAQFIVFLGDTRRHVETITTKECLAWLHIMHELGYHPNCINRKCSTLRTFFSFLKTQGYRVIDSDAIPAPKLCHDIPHIACTDEYQKLLDQFTGRGYAHKRNRALLMLVHDSFARVGELASLNVRDIDQARMSAIIKTEKSRYRFPFREIYWTKETNDALQEWIQARSELIQKFDIHDHGALFIGVKRGSAEHPGNRMTSNAISDVFRRYSKKAGLDRVCNAHSFRHRGGRELCKSGANAYVISSILGHKDPQSSYRYTMLFSDDREKIYRKMFG